MPGQACGRNSLNGVLGITCYSQSDPEECAEFQIGVSGIEAKIAEGKVTVTKTVDGSPAHGKFQAGDVLVSVGGKVFGKAEIQSGGGPNDPRVALGKAIGTAEGGDGRMLFGVEREGKASDVTIQLKAMRPDIEARVTGRDQVQMQDVLKKVDACIADYEAKYGKVEAEGGRG